jgi:integrase
MALTDTFIRNIKYSGRRAGDKHTDGQGLYLLVNAAGKYWRLNYRYLGKQKTLALGVYPAVTLAKARSAKDVARTQIAENLDPSVEKRAAKRSALNEAQNTFQEISSEWLTKTASERKGSTQVKLEGWFKHDIWPLIGNRPITAISAAEILQGVVKRLEARGVNHTAHRIVNLCSKVFRYSIVTERAKDDPTLNLRGALAKHTETNYSSITDPEKLRPLMRAIEGYVGHHSVKSALKLLPLVFVRPGELRHAEWSEMYLELAQWKIPSQKMKMGNEHIVPLSKQAMRILEELRLVTGHGKYVFPSIRSHEKPISDNALNAALRALGFSGKIHTAHGFRATYRTIADEVLNERVDLIEHQLAHKVMDVNGIAYNRTTHLPERRNMMQRWADYLDDLAKS